MQCSLAVGELQDYTISAGAVRISSCRPVRIYVYP